MATKYARAGGGNWSADATWSTTSGGAADTTAPTAADDVRLDAASGNVTIDTGATRLGRSLDCDGYTGTLTQQAVSLNLGDGTAGAGNIALRLSAGMSYPSPLGTIGFVSSSATQQTVTTAGITVRALNFAASGSWLLSDATTMTNTLTLTQGTLNTNGQTVTAADFLSSNSNTRTLTLGSSAITLSSTGTAWSAATVTNLTVTANTATVTLSGAGATFSSGAINWNGLSVVMSGSGTQVWNCSSTTTVANLSRIGTAAKTDALQVNVAASGCVVSGTFTVTGNSDTNRVLVRSSALGTAQTITAAATSLTNVDFRDITGAGAATWSGTSIGDCGGNTNITADTPITCYRVGAGGNWSDSSWYTTSGGATPARVPLPQDTARVDANASGTITNDMPRMGGNIDFTGFAGTLALGSTATEIYGSVTLGSGMVVTGTAVVSMRGRSTHTFTTNGVAWPAYVVVWTPSGTYTLGSACTFTLNGSNPLNLIAGAFNDDGFAVAITGALGTYRQDGGTLTASGTWTIASTTATVPWNFLGGTLNHTGEIRLTGATTTARTFAGGGKTYGTLTDTNTSSGQLTITGANTFGTINKTAVAACTLNLPDGVTTTITNAFNVNGQPGAVLTLDAA